MARAVLIDLKREGAGPEKGWTPESMTRTLGIVQKANDGQDPLVCIMCCQGLPGERNREDQSQATVQALHCPEHSLEVVCAQSTIAALYTIKQKLDEKGISRVLVLSLPQQKAFLRVFVDQLFTSVYQFEFGDLQVDLEASDLEPSPRSPREFPPPVTDQDVGRIQREIRSYLEGLPALKGELRILRSGLIPGKTGTDCTWLLLLLQPRLRGAHSSVFSLHADVATNFFVHDRRELLCLA